MNISQPISAKIGEIKYRKKLSCQHQSKNIYFQEEYSACEIQKIIKEKINRTQNNFYELQKQNIIFSPFLEIGSERGQASLVLSSQFNAYGYASDISNQPLQNIARVGKNFKLNKIPKTLICDAENLPFADNSFSLVFCYQMLHHFSNPLSVTQEILRVLKPGGYFYFAEEPIKQYLLLPFWRRPTKLRWWEIILKKLLILPFISQIGKTEVDHGILENTFSLSVWKKALNIFEYVETILHSYPFGPECQMNKNGLNWKRFEFKDTFSRILLFILGGGIRGLAQKKGKLNITKKTTLQLPPFICINCHTVNKLKKSDYLIKKSDIFFCRKCKSKYPIKNNMPILLNSKLLPSLYPNI